MTADDDWVDWLARVASGDVQVMCECSSLECVETLPKAAAQYVSKGRTGQYVVMPGHEEPTDEILEEHPGFLLVRDRGDAASNR